VNPFLLFFAYFASTPSWPAQAGWS
jgi:hypothetical protein